MTKGDYLNARSASLPLRHVFPGSISFGGMFIIQLLLIAVIVKLAFPPVREGLSETMISFLTSRAEKAVESGDFERAGARLRSAIAIGSEQLPVNRRLMATSRYCDRDVWETATAIVFFHRDSKPADRREILMWSLLRGELTYFDKLVSCLPQEWLTQDRSLSQLVELRAMATIDRLSRNETRQKRNQGK